MDWTWEFIRGILILLGFGAGLVWLLIRWLRRSHDDPGRLISKWIISGIVIGFVLIVLVPTILAGGYGAAFMMPMVAVCGLILAVLWVPNIAGMVARPISALYDGGQVSSEPRPFYSIASAKRKRGQYHEAIREIQKQLERFPGDFEGQMMVAEIQAENLNDLQGAQISVERICNQPSHPPRNIAFALSSIADWQLKYAQDRDAARQALERIITMFPDSEPAQLAAQRIAHLSSTERLLESHDRARIALPHFAEDVGLKGDNLGLVKPEDPAAVAAGYVKHLEEYPQDNEIREKLALLYADHYRRLDLAQDQLEQLIAQPNVHTRHVVHWLNLLADVQVKLTDETTAAAQSLQRIVERFPHSAASETAERRLAHLPLELRANKKSQAIALGSYEQDIGLKRR